MNIRKILSGSLAALIIVGMQMLPISAKNGDVTMGKIDIKTMGAKGDGKTDDTKAILDAVSKAQKEKKDVFVPNGNYRISSSIALEGIDMIGNASGAFSADNDVLPTFQVTMTSAPAFVLKSNCTITGFKIQNMHSGSNQTYFKESISIAGNSCTVKNIKLADVATGIQVNGTNVKNLVLENVFMVNPFVMGVHVRNTAGKTVLRNIEMWVPSTAQGSPFSQNGIGILAENNENLDMNACFSFNAHTGIKFQEAGGKGSTAVLNNCSVDLATAALVVDGTHQITVKGGTYWTHFNSIDIKKGNSFVTLDSVEARSNGGITVRINGGKNVVLKNSIAKRIADGHNKQALSIGSGCASATIEGCIIYSKNNGIETVSFNNKSNIIFSNSIVNTINTGESFSEITSNVKMSNTITGNYVN